MSHAATELAPTDALKQVDARLARIEAALSAVASATDRAPVLIDAVASTATWGWQQAEAHGVDPIQSGEIAARIAMKAAHPGQLLLIERLLAHQDLLEVLVDTTEQLKASGDLNALLTHGRDLAPLLANLARSPELKSLLDAGALDPATLSVVVKATTALVETRKAGPPAPIGLFGQLGALRDTDVQRAIGFTLQIAKRFGALLAR